jgi:hypothetical protein
LRAGRKKDSRWVLRAALASTVLAAHAVGCFGPALAADMVISPPGQTNPFEKPNREYNGLPLGAWLFYPELFVGLVFDGNPNQSPKNVKSAVGLEVSPRLTGVWNDGIHKLTVYGLLDARLYSDHSTPGVPNSNQTDMLNAKVGFDHVWEAQRNLVVRFGGDYTRQTDPFAGSVLSNPIASGSPQPIVVTPTANASFYNQFSGSGSVTKTFGTYFGSLGGNITNITFDNSNALNSLNGTIYAVTGRAGVLVGPMLYAFVEPTLDWRRYQTSAFDSHGYRVVGGVGSDQIGLFRGEVYGGYQAEQRDNSNPSIFTAAVPNSSSGVFGGRVYYYPTRYWTVNASLDETLGVSLVTTPSSPLGTSTRATTALVRTDYSVWETWTAGARFGYIRTDYTSSSRQDDAWLAGGTIGHRIWANLAATLDYQFTKSDSNAPLQGFTRSVIMAGVNYRY